MKSGIPVRTSAQKLEQLACTQSAKAALTSSTPPAPPANANYCDNSSNAASTPYTPPNTKMLSRKTIKVGDTIDYFAPHSVVGVSNNMCSGVVTSIFPTHSLEEMTDTHLVVDGLYSITYGRPI
jgi:hypothetical protein